MSQLTIQPIISAVKLKKYINVMYALDSAHEEVRRLNRCRTFAVLLDWRSRIERRVDTSTNLSNLIDTYVELFMCRI